MCWGHLEDVATREPRPWEKKVLTFWFIKSERFKGKREGRKAAGLHLAQLCRWDHTTQLWGAKWRLVCFRFIMKNRKNLKRLLSLLSTHNKILTLRGWLACYPIPFSINYQGLGLGTSKQIGWKTKELTLQTYIFLLRAFTEVATKPQQRGACFTTPSNGGNSHKKLLFSRVMNNEMLISMTTMLSN